MPNLSPDVQACKLSEYEYYLEERVQEAELSVEGLYLFMSKAVRGVEAVRCPTKILALEREDGLLVVDFTLLSQDLKPTLEYDGTISDGMLSGEGGDHNLINASYFRNAGLVKPEDDKSIKAREAIRTQVNAKSRRRVLTTA